MSSMAGGSQGFGSRVYDQEVALNNIFDDLSEGFKKLDDMSGSKKQNELKIMTAKMQEAKAYVVMYPVFADIVFLLVWGRHML